MITIKHIILKNREVHVYHDGSEFGLHAMILKDGYFFSEDGMVIFKFEDVTIRHFRMWGLIND